MGQKFPGKVSRNSQNSWISEMRTIQPKILEIPGAKLNGKKTSGIKFPKIRGYLARLSGSIWKSWKMLFHPLLEVAEIQIVLFGWIESALEFLLHIEPNTAHGNRKKKLRQDKETMQLSACVVFDFSFFISFLFYLYRYTCKMNLSTCIIPDQFFSCYDVFNHEAKSPHMIDPHENKNSLYIYPKSLPTKVHLKMHLLLQMSHYHM